MKKIAYIIPGFRHSTNAKEYKEVAKLFELRQIKTVPIKIHWKYRTMTDYVDEFLAQVKHEKDDEAYLFGFSWGAMIALISARKIKPKKLILASLSPYFREDLPAMKNWWRLNVGKKRELDFKKYEFNAIAKRINCPTILLAGEKECQKYKRFKYRVNDAHKKIKNSKLIMILNAKHDLGQKEYLEAIKNLTKKFYE